MSARLHGAVKNSVDYQHVTVATTAEDVSRSLDSLPRGAGAALRPAHGWLHEGVAPGGVHGREAAGSRDEVVRGAVLHDTAVFHHEHPVGDRDRR